MVERAVLVDDRTADADQHLLRSDRYGDPLDINGLHTRLPQSLVEVDAARPSHEIHHDLIGYAHDSVARDLVVAHVLYGVVVEMGKRPPNSLYIGGGGIDQEIDVFRTANVAVENDRKAADQNVTSFLRVQPTTELDEVFDLWRA